MQVNKGIYLDYAASAPLCDRAKALLQKYYLDESSAFQANPNSLHDAGRKAFSLLEDSRKKMSKLLGANRPSEIVFCSGATEANNACLFGIGNLHDYSKLHLIISKIEHPSVYKAAEALRSMGAKLDFVDVDFKGQVRAEQLEEILQSSDSEIKLVSIQFVNSEIGVVQDISNLANIVHAFPNSYFHSDTSQALGKLSVNLQNLGIDAASFSAHKIGACKSSGCMFVKNATPFKPLLNGGGQEGGKRSGTQDAISAHIFAEVLEHEVLWLDKNVKTCRELKSHLLAGLDSSKLKVNLDSEAQVPNIVDLQMKGLETQTALLRLSEKAIYISGGSACSSSSLEPSHVLKAIGLSTAEANSSIRISFSANTSKDELNILLEALHSIL